MIALGIDPGLSATGYAAIRLDSGGFGDAVIIEAGVFRLDRRGTIPGRLRELEGDLEALIERTAPCCACVESLFAHYGHPRTAISMAHARGVILLTLAKAGLPLVEVPPTTVKKAVTGNGRASKAQVQAAVMQTLGLRERPEPADVADAMALALCGLRRHVGGVEAALSAGAGRKR